MANPHTGFALSGLADSNTTYSQGGAALALGYPISPLRD